MQPQDTTAIVDSTKALPSETLLDTSFNPSELHIVIDDTLKFIDTGNVLQNPTFYISVISIAIALTAIILPIIRAGIKEKKRLNSLENYVFYVLENLFDPINKKIDNLNELSKNMGNIENRNFGFAESTSLLTHVFKELPHQDLHKIFVVGKTGELNNRIKHFKNMTDSVDYFSRQNDIDKKNFFQFMEDLRRYERQFNENVDLVIRRFDSFVSFNQRANIRPSKDPFLKGFDFILHTWKSDENFSQINNTKKKMLEPLRQHCIKFSDDERAVEILPYIIKCIYAFNDITNLRELYKQNFNESAKKLQEWKNALEKSLAYFKGV